jgi:hypothetical protein
MNNSLTFILAGLIVFFIGKKQDSLVLQYIGILLFLGLGMGIVLESTLKKIV